MYTIYSKSKRDGAAWVYVTELSTAIATANLARHLHDNGYEVSIDSSEVETELDSPYNK